MMKVVVVDDEPLARRHLCSQLEQLEIEVAGEADSADKALSLARELSPDLLFVDIHLPGINGLQLAEELEAMPTPPFVVFVTAHTEYAVKAFLHGSVDYLVKPVDRDRLHRTMKRATERIRERQAASEFQRSQGEQLNGEDSGTNGPATPTLQRLAVREDYSVRLIPIDDIVCAAARDKRVYIRTAAGEYRSSYTLKQLETILPSARFFRVHDAYIVRLDLITELHSLGSHAYAVTLKGGLLVPVSRSRYKDLQRCFGVEAMPTGPV